MPRGEGAFVAQSAARVRRAARGLEAACHARDLAHCDVVGARWTSGSSSGEARTSSRDRGGRGRFEAGGGLCKRSAFSEIALTTGWSVEARKKLRAETEWMPLGRGTRGRRRTDAFLSPPRSRSGVGFKARRALLREVLCAERRQEDGQRGGSAARGRARRSRVGGGGAPAV